MKFKQAPVDVVGISNVLMDISVQVEDKTVSGLGLNKGVFNLVDQRTSENIYKQVHSLRPIFTPGGGVSNCIGALAVMGANTMLYGQVGKDELGKRYEEAIIAEGSISRIHSGSTMTGSAITFITPDSQRTFAVHLGAACELATVSEKDIADAKILYVTGYELEPPIMSATVFRALEIAKKHHVKVVLDVADPFLILRNHRRIIEVISNYMDVCFVNEKEAYALFGTNPVNSLNALSKLCDIGVVKVGENGSYIKRGEDIIHIEAPRVLAIDTTGAGDVYAAGFLYGLLNHLPLPICAEIGTHYAAKIVTKIGARLMSGEIESKIPALSR